MGVSDWIRRKLAILAIATSNVEKNALGGEKNTLSDGIGQERYQESNRLSYGLLKGELTQQVQELRWRMYKVLGESEKYKTRIIGTELDEMGDVRNITETYVVSKSMDKITLEPSDDYPLEMVVNNDTFGLGIAGALEGELGKDEKLEKTILINREFPSKLNIEQYADKLMVRTINNEEKLLEFYLSMYTDEFDRKTVFLISEIKKCMKNPKSSNILDITEVGFLSTNTTVGTGQNNLFEYKITSFDKIVEFNGHYVIKFKAKVLVNGENVFEQYRMDDLDQKYDDKALKDIK